MLTHRGAREADRPAIVAFPQNRKELFHIFPAATCPLTVEQLRKAVETRFGSTVVLQGHAAVAANLRS